MVIGADGVHSKVRQSMRELAMGCSAPVVNEDKPYLSEYKLIWCTFPRQPCNDPGDTIEIHGRNISLQCLNSQKRSWLFIYEKLDTPTRERVTYSQQEVEEFAVRHGELAVCEHLKVRDVFPMRYTAGMTNLEEGIVKNWSWERMVLVGDACHKFTPNQGLGFNNGIQDLVVLINELNGALTDGHRSGNAVLPLESLARVFSRYQATRVTLLQKDMSASASWTRMSAWGNCILHLLDRYVLPAIPKMDEFAINHTISGPVSSTFVLDFLESEEPFHGKVPWEHAMKGPAGEIPPQAVAF
jgi:2-polyprenyl-6-methoxyphenol hydroxylase-like FAD-dependent oxidoreductase